MINLNFPSWWNEPIKCCQTYHWHQWSFGSKICTYFHISKGLSWTQWWVIIILHQQYLDLICGCRQNLSSQLFWEDIQIDQSLQVVAIIFLDWLAPISRIWDLHRVMTLMHEEIVLKTRILPPPVGLTNIFLMGWSVK